MARPREEAFTATGGSLPGLKLEALLLQARQMA